MRHNADGLVPCAVKATVETGEAHLWSRSRRELWHEGATSGNTQRVVEARLDCDHDATLLTGECAGPACHTGALSCFHEAVNDGAVTEPSAQGGVQACACAPPQTPPPQSRPSRGE